MTPGKSRKEEIDVNDEMDLETMKKKSCPTCGKPMRWLDGDYICVSCNGADYGPEEG